MLDKLFTKIYRFLFIENAIGFCRLCFLLTIPAAIFETFCRIWLIVLVFLQTLVLWARFKGWNREEDDDADYHH